MKSKPDARTRLIETAERLFYAEGINTVGIDRIIAEAAVAKMTLYNHFASKDELILEVLKYREQQVLEFFEESMAAYQEDDGLDRLAAFFATLKEWFDSPEFRGCSFINASVELADRKHPAARFAAHHKNAFHALIGEIIAETAGKKAAAAAPAISMLVEGAIVTALLDPASNPADLAEEAAMTLIAKAKRARAA